MEGFQDGKFALSDDEEESKDLIVSTQTILQVRTTSNISNDGQQRIDRSQGSFGSNAFNAISADKEWKIEVQNLVWRQENILKVPGLTGFYEFTLQVVKDDEKYFILRRYSEFLLLRKALEVTYPGLFIFPLPPKDKFL